MEHVLGQDVDDMYHGVDSEGTLDTKLEEWRNTAMLPHTHVHAVQDMRVAVSKQSQPQYSHNVSTNVTNTQLLNL